jgi:hypothetical protein
VHRHKQGLLMLAHIVMNERAEHQASWGGAFGAGLARHGWRVTYGRTVEACDLLCLWGVRKRWAIDAQKQAGGEVVVLERGYVGDRFEWTSVSFGGALNGRAEFRGPFHDRSRWERHFAHLMKPWRVAGNPTTGYALIVGQVAGDMSLGGTDLQPWYAAASFQLHKMGWQVRFRPHPVSVQRYQVVPVQGAETIKGTLEDALAGASVVVTYNSNTGVESVLAGVPTIAMDAGSMAWPVAGHAIDEIVTPDRTAWAHALAWKQWRREEIADGTAWEHLQRTTERYGGVITTERASGAWFG